MIRIDSYFGQHAGNSEITDEIKQNAQELLDAVNQLMLEAQEAGCLFSINPATQSYVSGSKSGGFRPSTSTVGAPKSKHRTGQAVDIYDEDRMMASFCLANKGKLADLGLYMEDPRWTVNRSGQGGWVHLQSVAPNSGQVVFRPSMDEPLAGLPPPWIG